MKINILCDNKNSWFWDTNKNFLEEIEKLGNDVKVFETEESLSTADITAFISCTRLVSPDGLSKSKSNIVCHPSDLPEGRGFSPIAWEILNNKDKITFTLFEANEKADEGVIYSKQIYNLTGNELSDDLRQIQSEITYNMILDYIKKYPNNNSYSQIGEGTWYPKRTPSDSELDTNKTILEQINLLRIVDNQYYPAFFYYKDAKYILKIYKE